MCSSGREHFSQCGSASGFHLAANKQPLLIVLLMTPPSPRAWKQSCGVVNACERVGGAVLTATGGELPRR